MKKRSQQFVKGDRVVDKLGRAGVVIRPHVHPELIVVRLDGSRRYSTEVIADLRRE